MWVRVPGTPLLAPRYAGPVHLALTRERSSRNGAQPSCGVLVSVGVGRTRALLGRVTATMERRLIVPLAAGLVVLGLVVLLNPFGPVDEGFENARAGSADMPEFLPSGDGPAPMVAPIEPNATPVADGEEPRPAARPSKVKTLRPRPAPVSTATPVAK